MGPTPLKKMRRAREPAGTILDAPRANPDSFFFGHNRQELIEI